MIEGSLQNVPLSDVFQVIVTGQKSGILTVSRGHGRARIYFERGGIQYGHITPGVHLGEILIRMDLLTTHEVQQILRQQSAENAGTPLGLMAIDMGLITQEDLRSALHHQVHEVLFELLTWKEGMFHFAERSELASQVPTEHTLDAMQLLMNIAQRLEDWQSGTVAPRSIFVKRGDPTQVAMPEGGWEVLGYVDASRSARSIAAELDLSDRHVYRILYELLELGVIEELAINVEDPLVLVISPSPAQQRLIRLALQRARLRTELAGDLEAGMRILQEEHPNAIVVDDSEGEGWEFVKELRKLPGQGHLPVMLLLEEKPNQGLFGRLRRPRATTLVKPFHELEFQQLITHMVGRPLA